MQPQGLLKVSGKDAHKLLQGQLTCDMNEVTSTQAKLGAQCNPQGRIIYLFHIFLYEDEYYLQMPRSMVAIALAALKKYAVFFKVTLTDASDQRDPPIPTQAEILSDLKSGYAMIYPETSGMFLPHELNLPQLEGVSFTKGCFTGQEIIARMQYRGKLKNQLCLATCEEKNLTRGNDIFDEKGIAGKIVDYAENTLLILTHDSNQPLFLDEARTQRIQVNHVN